jgi:hypothetical protein
VNIDSIRMDLRRYGKANIGSFHTVTGNKTTGYTLWKWENTAAGHIKRLVATFNTLEALLEAL